VATHSLAVLILTISAILCLAGIPAAVSIHYVTQEVHLDEDSLKKTPVEVF
jgi:hypothetical protein